MNRDQTTFLYSAFMRTSRLASGTANERCKAVDVVRATPQTHANAIFISPDVVAA
jgi:hypothetical protein